MNKQTAMQYLIQEIKNDLFLRSKSAKEWNKVFEQALQMEHEQMIDAHVHGHNAPSSTIKQYDAQQYINETYGGK
jgi:hypothetical protein